MSGIWTFHTSGQLLFGCGAAQRLGQVAEQFGLRRLFIVTDRALVEAGVAASVSRSLTESGCRLELFDGGQPGPTIELAEQCVAQARRFNPDGLVGLGGGSNMDLAKAAATLLTHGGSPRDYVGDDRVPGPILPLICVPTTAGTGSEVTFAAVLTDTETKLKVPYLSNYIRPKVAVVDPELTVSCPAKVTADSGVDALTHAVEAYTAVDNAAFPLPPGERTVFQGRHPLGELLAEKAIALIGRHLVRALNEPSDLAAREGMALAATLAGLAFSNVGVAVSHALETAVGGAGFCSHGAGNGLLLPHVLRFNLPACQPQLARIAQLLGRPVHGLDQQQAAEEGIAAVEQLLGQVGMPRRLSQLGVTPDLLPSLAQKAAGAKRILRVNPREVTESDLEAILRQAL